MVNYSEVVIGFSGKPLMNGEDPVTVGFLLQQCLDIVQKEDSMETKMVKGRIIHRIGENKELEKEEVAILADCIPKAYGPFIMYKLYGILSSKGE